MADPCTPARRTPACSSGDSSSQVLSRVTYHMSRVTSRYLNDVGHHWAGWVLGSGPGLGSLSNDEDGDCPSSLAAAWDVSDGGEGWVGDTSLSVTCQ